MAIHRTSFRAFSMHKTNTCGEVADNRYRVCNRKRGYSNTYISSKPTKLLLPSKHYKIIFYFGIFCLVQSLLIYVFRTKANLTDSLSFLMQIKSVRVHWGYKAYHWLWSWTKIASWDYAKSHKILQLHYYLKS